MAEFTSTVTTHETDIDSSGKQSTKDIIATTAPAATTQYEHADWLLSTALPSATIAVFDIVGNYAQGIFLSIHRITNEGGQDVVVETEHSKTLLGPGRSIDVSSAQITISVPAGAVINDLNPPHGGYQLLCCSIVVAQASAARLSGTDTPAPSLKTPGGGGGGGNGDGGNGGGPNGGGGKPQPKPDPPPSDLDALKQLEAEAKAIRDKLDIARRHGQGHAADQQEQLLKLVERHIGEAAIALAIKEIEQLGRDAKKRGGGS